MLIYFSKMKISILTYYCAHRLLHSTTLCNVLRGLLWAQRPGGPYDILPLCHGSWIPTPACSVMLRASELTAPTLNDLQPLSLPPVAPFCSERSTSTAPYQLL